MEDKKFKVFRAGAGSGKTFQLIKEILALALSQPSHDYYRHILAITFTNAAAFEMRDRFLKALKEFADKSVDDLTSDALFEQVQIQTQLSPKELKSRAANTYRHVLHHYDLLSIGTIDSFAQRLVRGFSFELNIASDFGLELETNEFYERVVNACLDQVGIDQELSTYLTQLVLEQLEDEADWKTKNLLGQYAKELTNEKAVKAIDKLLEYPEDFFTKAKREARRIEVQLCEERTALAREIIERLSKYSTDVEDFNYKKGGFYQNLKRVMEGDMPSSFGRLTKVASDGEFFGKSSPYRVSAEDSEWLQNKIHQILSYLTGPAAFEIFIYRVISSKIMLLGLLKSIAHVARTVREEERILLISDLHKRVNDVLVDQSSPFIFERLGVQFKHVLIDEFQDTSEVQWSNMLPLFANSLSENLDTMVVGDAKQSIYRFRGGKVRQFVDLPLVPGQHMSSQEKALFASSFVEQLLVTNRRSDEVVVNFNNALYRAWSAQLPGLKQVYDDVKQAWTKQGKGWVTAQVCDKKDAAQSVYELVKERIQDNFWPSEIAILVLRKDLGYNITKYLMERGIRVQSEESLLLSNSPKVSFIEAWLYHLERPTHQESALALVAHLSRIMPSISVADFTEFMQSNDLTFSAAMQEMIQPLFPALFTTSHQDIYDEATRLIAACQWEMDVFLEFFMNLLFQKSRKEYYTRNKWNEWWGARRDKMSIKAAADPTAVRLMTVHKSKGLEFPCVIFCCMTSNRQNESEWFRLPENAAGVEDMSFNIVRNEKSLPYQIMTQNGDLAEQNNKFIQEVELEEMNVRYVATTRAKNVLHLLVGQRNLDTAMWAVIESIPDGTKMDQRLEWGARCTMEARTIAENPVTRGIRLGSSQQMAETQSLESKTQEQVWGDFVHRCLALIKNKADILPAIESQYRPHVHSQWLAKEALIQAFDKLIDQPQISPWFEMVDELWLERDILLSTGAIMRPDRVMRKGDNMVVVDYKTGQRKEEHHAQVQSYMVQLQHMYPNLSISGYLWYLESNECIAVAMPAS